MWHYQQRVIICGITNCDSVHIKKKEILSRLLQSWNCKCASLVVSITLPFSCCQYYFAFLLFSLLFCASFVVSITLRYSSVLFCPSLVSIILRFSCCRYYFALLLFSVLFYASLVFRIILRFPCFQYYFALLFFQYYFENAKILFRTLYKMCET